MGDLKISDQINLGGGGGGPQQKIKFGGGDLNLRGNLKFRGRPQHFNAFHTSVDNKEIVQVCDK